MSKSILQDWVMGLELRHQGVLLTAVRGCDTAPKHDASKAITKHFRAVILNAHCGDPTGAATFIQVADPDLLKARIDAFRKDLDHYPHHYVMHFIHACEIVGYKHPDDSIGECWLEAYRSLCRGLHVNPETEPQLDERLNADEASFARRDRD